MKKLNGLCVVVVAFAVCGAAFAECPSALRARADALYAFFSDRAAAGVRVELSGIAHDHFVDPPIKESEFSKRSTLTISVSSLECSPELVASLKLILDSDWRVSENAGYPRWSFSVTGAANNDFRVLIDRENSMIEFAGTWYHVPPPLVEFLTERFLRLVGERFGTSTPPQESQKAGLKGTNPDN